ncbi:2,4-dienoyl-CoA reductase [Acrasis kona]|uniref:2,4-dienoyl-CoA reductase [(3E)-enoyl-CoA-producing] n=1 Tax=Acrasis kona TaxID=1008807 RepID=A0AAW2ZA99_9EUKA
MSNKTFADNFLRGHSAIVTGGGSGIGKGIVDAYLEHGCNVAIVGRKKDRLDATAAELMRKHNNGTLCVAVQADVRDYKLLSEAFDNAAKQIGRITILVNGAAGNFLAPITGLSSNAFKTVMDIDTVGTFNASKLAHEKWFKENGGNIINLSANLHMTAQVLQVHAGAAKAAIDAMTGHMAVEWGGENIRVNSICIGPIDETEGFSRLLPPNLIEDMRQNIPLLRFGKIQDIANMCLYLSSPASSYVTGAIIKVDGGSTFTSGCSMPQYMNKMKSFKSKL